MTKQNLGLIIAILAICGGSFAIYELFFQNNQQELPINKEAAGQFSSAFVSSYFSYSKERGFESITAFTDLSDRRKAEPTLLKKEVISTVPLQVTHVAGGYMKAQILLNIQNRYLVGEQDRQKEEVQQRFYLVSVSVMQNQSGYKVLHYPSIEPYALPEKMEPPYPVRANDEIVSRMRPFLDSFFRSFFVSTHPDELLSFIAGSGEITPLSKALEYVSLDSLQVYGEQAPWLVFVTIQVKDSFGMDFQMTYELFVKYESNKFVIEKIVNGGN